MGPQCLVPNPAPFRCPRLSVAGEVTQPRPPPAVPSKEQSPPRPGADASAPASPGTAPGPSAGRRGIRETGRGGAARHGRGRRAWHFLLEALQAGPCLPVRPRGVPDFVCPSGLDGRRCLPPQTGTSLLTWVLGSGSPCLPVDLGSTKVSPHCAGLEGGAVPPPSDGISLRLSTQDRSPLAGLALALGWVWGAACIDCRESQTLSGAEALSPESSRSRGTSPHPEARPQPWAGHGSCPRC